MNTFYLQGDTEVTNFSLTTRSHQTKMKIRMSYVLMALTFSQVRSSKLTDYEWDYLLFVQHWPFTVCSQWEDKSPKNNCTFPNDKTLWTIHGIWPTRINTEGPNFCNSTWHFNETELIPILPDLKQYWTNIEANTKLTSLWKHEWRKHGTCAARIGVFDSEVSYFRQGLTWVKTYNIGSILAQSNILPASTGYTISEIYNAVKNTVGKNPIIQCVIEPEKKESFISEIRLCFNKTLDLIDCDIAKVEAFWDYFEAFSENTNLLTNCDVKKPVMYLDQIPPLCTNKYEENQHIDNLMRLYNILQFLIWVTI